MMQLGEKEEIIDGYKVSSEMKKIWMIEIDLLKHFIDVCEKNNIRYFLADGSLLGAVRHKGFIPWDNDIDIAVPRSDYNKLLQIASQEFSYPYFFQSAYSDRYYLRLHSQLRRSDTTAILYSEKDAARFNQGIFIDIFPLDGCAPDKKAEKRQDKKIMRYNNISNILIPSWYIQNSLIKWMQKRIASIVSIWFSEKRKKLFFHNAEEIVSKYSSDDNPKLSYVFWPESKDIPREIFYGNDSEITYIDFEGIKVAAPNNWHKYLCIKFGTDYMTPKQIAATHSDVLFDTEKSFSEYLRVKVEK